MALKRGEIIGYDADKMLFRFTMMDGANVVACEISSVAMDDLGGPRWVTSKLPDRDAQFAQHREAIEELASEQFDNQPYGTRLVRIFAKHVRR
jgi:hypothetical protein